MMTILIYYAAVLIGRIADLVRPSVCPSVCLSVRLSRTGFELGNKRRRKTEIGVTFAKGGITDVPIFTLKV